MQRRTFLRAGAGAGSALALGLGASVLRFGDVEAATEDYKALIYIDLGGGNDGFNMIVPFDDIHYQQYAACRGSVTLSQASLSPLSAEYALHGAMAPMQSVWADKAMAVMHNLGSLARPLTKAQFNDWSGRNDNTLVPDGLMSHGGAPTLAQTGGSDLRWQSQSRIAAPPAGWGAKALDQLHARSMISVNGSPLFGVSATTSPLAVPGDQSNPGYATSNWGLQSFADAPRFAAFQQLAQVNAGADHKFYRAVAAGQAQNITFNAQMGPIIMAPVGDSAYPELSGAFAGAINHDSYGLVSQLFQIGKMIQQRRVLGGSRHIFYAGIPAFDTHGGQIGPHASALGALGHGLSAFYAGMKGLGLEKNFTAFTMSDFGRTFVGNGSAGTDHAWGNEHLVVGGAVDGGKFYGTFPELVMGGKDDFTGDGRWIPTQSLDQYSSTLLNWFDPSIDVSSIFGNLKNFSSPSLGFMKTA